jgi:hypothetical protein
MARGGDRRVWPRSTAVAALPRVVLRLPADLTDIPRQAKGDQQVVRNRATEDEWRVYYARADEVRALVGDPFRRHIQRETVRERVLILASTVLVLGLAAAFFLLTAR